MQLMGLSAPCAVCGILQDVRLHNYMCCVLTCSAVLCCCACSVSSIVLRGATEGMLDDVERALDDGINAYKVR
jgi:chaperonin GroEL (HSP60 family)